MKRKTQMAIKGIAIAMAMIMIFTMPTFAQDSSKPELKVETFAPTALGHVALKDRVYAEINNVNLVPTDNGQMATYTLTIHNESNSDLNFIDYWTKLRSKGGSEFSVSLVDNTVDRIPASSIKDIVYYSKVGKNISLSDLVVRIIKWDFTTDSFQRVLGDVQIPSRYVNITPSSSERNIRMNDSNLSIRIVRANIGKSEKFYRPDIKLTIKNNGSKSITLPDYQISVLTREGLVYPLNFNGIKDTVLNPLVSKDYQLSGSIPLEITQDNWRLMVSLPVTEAKVNIPITLFELPKATISDAKDDLGKDYTFSDSNGIYNIRLNGMYRLPLEDQDIISANLTISNKGTDSLPIPDLTGTFLMENAVEREASVISTDKIIGLQPGKSYEVNMMCTIPYTFDLSNVKLTVQEKDSSAGTGTTGSPLDLVQFSFGGDFTPISVIASAKNYEVADVGYRSTVNIRKAMTYKGNTSNIFAAQVTIQNNEKRQTNVMDFAGYFRKPDGTIYPATLSEMKDKVSPNGKALVYAWTILPQDAGTSDLQFVLGKAVKSGDSKNTESTVSSPVGYVDPVAFKMPDEEKEQDQLKNIDVYPYQLSIDHISTQIMYGSGELILKYNYDLTKDLTVKTNHNDQHVVIEVLDASNNVAFSKEFSLEQAEEGSTSGAFKIGSDSMILKWNDDPDLLFKIETLKKYSFNVYHQIEPGQKKLLASRQLFWFETTTD